MKLILKDGTEFEITRVQYASQTDGDTEAGVPVNVSFKLTPDPKALVDEIKAKFTEENISIVNVVKVDPDTKVSTYTDFKFTKVQSVNMFMDDRATSVDAYLV